METLSHATAQSGASTSPSTSGQARNGGGNHSGPSALAQKARKACLNCRRQKMRCKPGQGSKCSRCERSGVACEFKPRANSASRHSSNTSSTPASPPPRHMQSVLDRLQKIEERIGLDWRANDGGTASNDLVDDGTGPSSEDEEVDPEFRALWQTLAELRRLNRCSVDNEIWNKSIVRQLWLSFHANLPDLHFLPSKKTFDDPQPFLLAAVLYCSAVRGSPKIADLSPEYFKVICGAISLLSIPDGGLLPPADSSITEVEEWAFQTTLGIVLMSLGSEAQVKETGIWISVGYRLMVEYCPAVTDDPFHPWKRLFCGLQIADLERASLQMSCPVIPIEAPLERLRTPNDDQIYSLSRMMHTSLTLFTGRGLPTIWSCFSSTPNNMDMSSSTPPFTPIETVVIRDWARQLDDWLHRFSSATVENRKSVYRQYVLHRLLVLSIYHPARGCNLFSNSLSVKEQHELLLSARATLRLHVDDNIWSNWDFVMITWAALIVLQATERGVEEQDDMKNIRLHLNLLNQSNEPGPSLKRKLATCLERAMQGRHPLTLSHTMAVTYPQDANPNPGFDLPWAIFDEASLQSAAYQFWPNQA